MNIDINENRKKAEIYSEQKTFTFLRELNPSGNTSYYNGFIDEVKTDFIMFFDIELKKSFPVPIDRCILEVSAKVGVTEKQALDIYGVWKKGVEGE